MHKASAWVSHNPMFGSIDSLLASAHPTDMNDGDTWVTRVQSVSSKWQSHSLHNTAHQLLQDLPYRLLNDQISSYIHCKETAEDLRFSRKLLMIPRDCLILTSSRVTDKAYDSLFKVVRDLGKMTDGQRPKQLSKQIGQLSISSYPDFGAVDDDSFASNINKALASSRYTLVANEIEETTIYHQARKDFRRVVHASIIYAVTNPEEQNIDIARQGIALNRRFGDIKDNIMA